ncbi:MAG: zinc-binding dehydrogenase [Deltaproteobacteria bacterium]|nr:zinc-binding dehydrogenase [Deltaproteobacteria bacterium]MBW2396161.1 zinc-binding dehydrogenase [Deltaproteobacteria bacterium]
MRAAIMRDAKIIVDTVPEPEPQPGEVLVETLICGICGSDLHALQHGEQMVEASREAGAPTVMDLSRDVIMGHEFCAEILDYGPDTNRQYEKGTRVVHPALLVRGAEFHGIGYSNDVPGGFAERMLLMESMLVPVPNGLPSEHAALTEPVAVGIHAVARANVDAGDSAIVVGCGPVGLAVIAGLRLANVETIVAADFSPMRRALAERMGAHVVVDPAQNSGFDAWLGLGRLRPPAIFECVGVPGVLQDIIREAPRQSRIVVVGVTMQADLIKPMVAIVKELDVRFSFGYSPEEFAGTLHSLAEGKIEAEPLITGHSGLDGVAAAFEELALPDKHAKILVEPGR